MTHKNKFKVLKKKILIVDDEPDICEMITRYLERKGFAVAKAYNGKEGLEAIPKLKPDLIILDVLMPIMDGFSFLQSLKADTKYCNVPVIMLTVKGDTRHLEKGLSLQADFYLPKPFKLDNLMNFINIILKE